MSLFVLLQEVWLASIILSIIAWMIGIILDSAKSKDYISLKELAGGLIVIFIMGPLALVCMIFIWLMFAMDGMETPEGVI